MAEIPKDTQHILNMMDETCSCNAFETNKGKTRSCDCIAPVSRVGELCKNCKDHSHKWTKWE